MNKKCSFQIPLNLIQNLQAQIDVWIILEYLFGTEWLNVLQNIGFSENSG